VRPRHCGLWLLNATTPHELRCLLNDNVNVQQRPNRVWYTQAHNLAERAVGFISNNHGDRGGGKGVEAQNDPWAYRPFGEKTSAHVLDCLCPGMVLTVCE
jgi:hypothetical protein